MHTAFAVLLLHAIDATEASTVVEDFRKNGYAIVQNFASAAEVAAMKTAMQEKTDAYWAERSDPTVFRTDAGQEAAQARSRKFFESADRVEFFEEAEGAALNKAGHALHLGDDAFGRYATQKVRTLLRDLGYERPVLPQSMYIFKAPLHGGAVTSHQDATFLRTDPTRPWSGCGWPWMMPRRRTAASGRGPGRTGSRCGASLLGIATAARRTRRWCLSGRRRGVSTSRSGSAGRRRMRAPSSRHRGRAPT
ncbi:unnamed protein product [Pelagomonas calceolata]|uniref:Non-haem dioxygenase N-terminal domain-containing protein n=1 Tax=Pelagomonas calceolata TaxID=35677 RepID=A0A8J2SU87_9STRA|nr:unnamed protein product [Pelagomonas calceolata]